jgi:hypothetical protein
MYMPKFRKKPVEIEAVQVTDATFDAPHPNPEHIAGIVYDPINRCALIKTLEGTMRADLGDWIIRGVKGELYPCKPDIFAATYDEVITHTTKPTIAELEKMLAEPSDRKVHINPDGTVTAEVR